jgi:tetratricopeptide (TPR) repeat protein
MQRTFAGIVALCALSTGVAHAQTYATAQPLPATTSAPALHRQAIQREIVERFHLGLANLDSRDWDSAAAEFRAILALDPSEPQGSTAAYDLGIAQANAGRDGEAAHAFANALELDRNFLAAMANLIAVDVRRGDMQEARSVADRFVAAAPDSARALYSRGLVALKTGDAATARDDFSKLLRNDPQYAVAHYDLGLAQAQSGDYAAAQREFATALDLSPTYARASFALGTVLLHLGDRTGARLAFERAAHDAADDGSLRDLALDMGKSLAP